MIKDGFKKHSDRFINKVLQTNGMMKKNYIFRDYLTELLLRKTYFFYIFK